MSSSLPRLARKHHVAVSLVLLCLCFAIPRISAAELPAVQELIRQAEDACKVLEKRRGEEYEGPLDFHKWPSLALVEAKTYAGDHAGAVQTAQSLSGFQKDIALSKCCKIHFELTGKIAELPGISSGESGFEKLRRRGLLVDIAKVLAKSNRLEEATKFLPKDIDLENPSIYHLVEFQLFLVEDQVQRGDKQGAVKSLKQTWTILERHPEQLKRIYWLETLVKLGLRVEDRDQAHLIKDKAVELVHNQSAKEKANRLLTLNWAHVGKIQALLGQEKLAREAFDEALRQAEADDQNMKDAGFKPYLRDSMYIDTVGRIGTWQFAAGLKTEAAQSYGQAIARAEKIERGSGYLLCDFVESQSNEGDIAGALKTLENMQDAYWKALAYCRCAKKLVGEGRPADSRDLLEKAEKLADVEPEPRNSTDMFVKIAEVQAKAGDLPAAKRSLEKALKISRSTKANDHHQSIARCQVSIGFLEDAYETIAAIQEAEWRALPLAELARAAAKKKAVARKEGADK